jgi:hypothetical protein
VDAAGKYYDGRLMSWPDVEGLAEWDGLLLGNGMSINVWRGFDYVSLYEEAQLSTKDAACFNVLETTNFEVVLGSLDNSIKLVKAAGYKSNFLAERRRSPQRAACRRHRAAAPEQRDARSVG